MSKFNNVSKVECKPSGRGKECTVIHGDLEGEMKVDDVMISGANSMVTEDGGVEAKFRDGECRIYGDVLVCKAEF